MSDEDDKRFSLSPTQVVGSALAAMSVAFLTSWFGTAGTIAGAALGSVIATVGAATYTWSLRRTSEAVKYTAAQVKQNALKTNALPRTVADGPLRPEPPTTALEAQQVEPDDGGGATDPSPEPETDPDPAPGPDAAPDDQLEPPGRWQGFPWRRVALASAGVMLLCVLGITLIEVLSGQSLASISGNDKAKDTTVGNVFDNGTSEDTPAPSDDATTQTPEPDQASETPDDQPQPSTDPTPSSDPTQEPSDGGEPTTDATTQP